MNDGSTIWRALGAIRSAPDDDQSLARMAATAGYSPSHFHRQFRAVALETPKQATVRLRLIHAALDLVSSDQSILAIALDAGFNSHEVFTRAFKRQFHATPSDYRNRYGGRLAEREVVESVHSCVNLYGTRRGPFSQSSNRSQASNRSKASNNSMTSTITIERRQIDPQPILYIRRRISHSDLQATMGECFGMLYQHGVANGLAIAGYPITRYVDTGMGLWTVDFAMPLIEPAEGSGEMSSDVLGDCAAATAVHVGPYEALNETHTAIDQWIAEHGFETAGAAWEQYLTDPADVPDPADWRTDVIWPLVS